MRCGLAIAIVAVALPVCHGQSAENVLVVVNRPSNLSRRIGEYYVHKRSIPPGNVCLIRASRDEEISRSDYESQIERPVRACLKSRQLEEKVSYIVTTLGVPLKISGTGSEFNADFASVDSELTLLYGKMKGVQYPIAGPVHNPMFQKLDVPFEHSKFPMYLVTRLAAYTFEDMAAMIDHSLEARNTGKFIIDLRSADDQQPGDKWLRAAAAALPQDRVVLDATNTVLTNQTDVIGYASWGSNDKNRKQRMTGFHWLPGAIVTEFVSTDGRTFEKPPDSWNITTWEDRIHFFAGTPQNLAADFLHEGATGASGHVYEPMLSGTPRPEILLPAYYSGRNLAESYYLAIPGLSWQNIVLGDPLCQLGKPAGQEAK